MLRGCPGFHGIGSVRVKIVCSSVMIVWTALTFLQTI